MSKVKSRIAISSFFFIHGLCFSSWASRIPAIQDKLHLSEAGLGSVLFAIPVGSILSMPIATWLVGKYGSKIILILATLLYSCLLTTLGLAATSAQLMGLLMVYGFVGNLVNISVNTQGIDLEILYQKTVMSSLHGLWSAAGFLGAAVGAVMIGALISPFTHFVIILSMVVVIIAIAQHYLIQNPKAEATVSKSSFRWPDKELLILGIIAFCSMICEGAMFDWSGVYFKTIVGAQGAWVSAGYVAFMTTMAGTRFFADGFMHKFGFQKILLVSGLVIFTGFFMSILVPSSLVATLGFFLIGAGVSGIVPLVMSEAGKSKTFSASAAVATVSTIGFLGFLVGPPLVGWIAGASSLRVSFGAVAMMGLLMTMMSFRISTKS